MNGKTGVESEIMNVIYTIGHSNHDFDDFVRMLEQHQIDTVVDVRSNPWSRFAKYANQRTLDTWLPMRGIAYRYMGDRLGGLPAGATWSGKPEFVDMLRSYDARRGHGEFAHEFDPSYDEAIGDLCTLASERRVAIMCSEEDPAKCHRQHLLAPSLEESGYELLHIRSSGRAHPTKQADVGASIPLF